MFYALYLKDCTYHFVFTDENVEVATIEFDVTPHIAPLVTLRTAPSLSNDLYRDLRALAADYDRLSHEAWAMTREYLQGASGVLICDAHYGQMLFCSDFDALTDII